MIIGKGRIELLEARVKELTAWQQAVLEELNPIERPDEIEAWGKDLKDPMVAAKVVRGIRQGRRQVTLALEKVTLMIEQLNKVMGVE